MSQHRWIVFILDLLAIFLAYVAMTLLFPLGSSEDPINFWIRLLLIYCAYFPTFSFYLVHTPIFKRDFFKNLRISLVIWVWMILILCVLLFGFHLDKSFKRQMVFVFGMICLPLFVLERMLASYLARRYYRNPQHRRQAVVFANESSVLQTLNRLTPARLLDFHIVGIVIIGTENETDRKDYYYKVEQREEPYGRTYLAERSCAVDTFLQQAAIDEAFLSLPDSDRQTQRSLIERLEAMGIAVHLTMDTLGLSLEASRPERFESCHVFTFAPRSFEPQELFLKRLMDIVGGLVGCVICLLLGIVVCPAIYLEDPGPVIFKQKRVGRNGRVFDIYKFRSMYQDAEARKQELMAQNEMDGLMFKIKDDPRVTKVGKLIRKTSIDEFPQFFNVLKGEMSLIGTRPPTLEEFKQYSYYHKRRLSLKPGITGLWQISGRSNITDFEDVVKLDVEYIDHWSIWRDLRILVMTVVVVLTGRGSE